MDFRKINKIHFTGIKGVGMCALALYFQDMGKDVAGSDVSEVFVTDEILDKRLIKWSKGINASHINKNINLVITTAAHGGLENEEVKKAKSLGIPVLTYAEALAEISYEKETVCVCGVGGKTTISSMLSVLLDTVGMNPSFVVGVGNIYPLGVPGRYIKEGRNFICEADDYVISPGIDNRAKFSLLKPKIIIVTNIEYDHPDVYENFEKTKNTFLEFFNKLQKFGYLLANSDNKNTLQVSSKSSAKLMTYGFNKTSDYQIRNVKYLDQKTKFNIYIKRKRKLIENLEINVPGEYNLENAAAAFSAGDLLGIEFDGLKKGLVRYLGCRRRFEEMINYKGAIFYDDYAHHPGELKAALKALRQWFPKRRIIAIFQPHTFSRTKTLFAEFSKSFLNADVVAIMDIYSSARELFDSSVSSNLLAEEILKHKKSCYYVKDHRFTLKWIEENVKAGDVVITMGAGDIFHLYSSFEKSTYI